MSLCETDPLDRVERVLATARLAGVIASAAALSGIVLMITADTFFRYVLLRPFPATVEISQLVEPYVIFLPMAFALASGSHVARLPGHPAVSAHAARHSPIVSPTGWASCSSVS